MSDFPAADIERDDALHDAAADDADDSTQESESQNVSTDSKDTDELFDSEELDESSEESESGKRFSQMRCVDRGALPPVARRVRPPSAPVALYQQLQATVVPLHPDSSLLDVLNSFAVEEMLSMQKSIARTERSVRILRDFFVDIKGSQDPADRRFLGQFLQCIASLRDCATLAMQAAEVI